MFIQFIHGQVKDVQRFNEQNDRWMAELKPGAIGYLGCTWGVAPDGRAFLAARFESAEAAKANSDRAEQGAWWSETEPVFEDVSFQDCAEVDTMLGGGSGDAGFVQVIQGRVKDQTATRTMLRDAEDRLSEGRPDILGGYMAWHGDNGEFTQVVYFRSEEEAHAGESSASDGELDDEYRNMMATDPTFIDLAEPRFD